MQGKIVPTEARHFNREKAILPANACMEISLADHVMERVYNPINAVADLVALFLERADAGTRLFQLRFQQTYARGMPGCGIVSRFRHACFAFTGPRPRHASTRRLLFHPRPSRDTLRHTPKNLGGSLNHSQLDNPTEERLREGVTPLHSCFRRVTH
jgi:hypothetical protein